MRYLCVFILKCVVFVVWLITYIIFLIINLALSLWYLKPLYVLTYNKFSAECNDTPKEAMLDYLNMYKYKKED